MGKSLMDGMDLDTNKPSGGGGGGGGSNLDGAKIGKIVLAVVLILAAAFLLASNFGLIGGEARPKPTQEQISETQQLLEEAAQEEERLLIERPDLTPAGAG